MSQEIEVQNSNGALTIASTNLTLQQGSAPVLLGDDKHSNVLEAVKAMRDMRTSDGGLHRSSF